MKVTSTAQMRDVAHMEATVPAWFVPPSVAEGPGQINRFKKSYTYSIIFIYDGILAGAPHASSKTHARVKQVSKRQILNRTHSSLLKAEIAQVLWASLQVLSGAC